MKQFLTVFNFELGNYFKKKSFLISTAIISLVLIVILSIPSFFDVSKIIPGLGNDKESSQSSATDVKDETKEKFVIYDESGVIKDTTIFETIFANSEWSIAKSGDEINDAVSNGDVAAGYIVNDLNNFTYVINNKKLTDTNKEKFTSALSELYKKDSIDKAGLNYEQINAIYHTQINANVDVLGKDSSENYFYAYVLIFVLYMMTLMYGQLIAVSVTSEKSNRAIEVLVTSASSNSLIFGKVIAGAVASIVQTGTIMASGIIGYKLNSATWNGLLDNVFNIPGELLLTFALFGIVGYLFYAFIFGALGALVSKTEEIGTSIMPVTLIFVAVFLISMFGLSNSDLILIKVASFIPFSSPMTMLIRVAMGTVSIIEIIASFIILVVSTLLTGIAGAKIYRRATLMYGNPIKLRNALKWFKKENN